MTPDRPTVPFNDLTRYASVVWERSAARWAETLRSGRVILGFAVSQFEEAFAAYLGGGHVIGVGNGTDAIELGLRSVGVVSGASVLTAGNAGFYSSSAILSIGASPTYVDVNPQTTSPDANSVRLALATDDGIAAVVITHLYGRVADEIEAIATMCREHGVPLVEDCSQSHGARSGGVSAGAFGDVAAFSFYPTKNLGALGDGGAVFTTSDRIAGRLRSLRQYGWGSKYVVDDPGGRNSRLDEVQAIVLLTALEDLEHRNELRRRIIDAYRAATPHLAFPGVSDSRESWVGHLGVIAVDDRAAVRERLTQAGVSTDIHFPVPDHRQPVMAGMTHGPLPHTEALAGRILSVPCFPDMTATEIEQVANALASSTT
jgi:aminotransferase EvaB